MPSVPLDRDRALRFAAAAAGVLLCAVLAFSRLPRLYDGLWEDEVHYNFLAFAAPSFAEFRDKLAPLMRPMLDLAVKKWVLFSPVGLPLTERDLALVPWVLAAVHLVALVCVPWTPYRPLRVAAGLLLGFCAVEAAQSVEAQGYSLASLASTILAFALLRTAKRLKEAPTVRALPWFAAGFALSLNTHYFSWPYAAVLLGALAAYIACDRRPSTPRAPLLTVLLAASAVVAIVTVLLNAPSIRFLLQTPPYARPAAAWSWSSPLPYVQQAWTWLSLPAWIYLPAAAAALFHADREKRFLAWGLAVSVLPLKYATAALMLSRSSYPISDRYFIMFVGPAILLFCLGLESAAERADRWRARSGARALGAVLVILALCVPGGWRAAVEQAWAGLGALRANPGNYSPASRFFETAKSFDRPLLVLTNHCWASDVPRFYLEHLGRPPRGPAVVVNVWPGCETPALEKKAAVARFFAEHRADGVVAFFYEIDRGRWIPEKRPDPCASFDRAGVLYRDERYACLAIFDARWLSPDQVLKM